MTNLIVYDCKLQIKLLKNKLVEFLTGPSLVESFHDQSLFMQILCERNDDLLYNFFLLEIRYHSDA